MDLHRVPDEQRAEIPDRDPPETTRAHGAAQRPVHRDPGRIDDVCARSADGAHARQAVTIGFETDVLWPSPHQQIERQQQNQDHDAQRQARGSPARAHDHALEPWQQDDRAHADTGKREAHREPAAADEPVGQEQSLAGVTQADAAAAHQHAECRVKLPWFLHQRRQQQSRTDQDHPQFIHDQRAALVHQPAKRWAHDCRHDEAEREGAGRRAAIPAELVEDRREQQGECGARIHRHAHGDEDDGHDDPAIEERQARIAGALRRRRHRRFRRASRAWRSPYFMPSSLSPSGSRKNTA